MEKEKEEEKKIAEKKEEDAAATKPTPHVPVAPAVHPVAAAPAGLAVADDEPFVVSIARCNNCKGAIFEGGTGAQGYTFYPDGGKDRTGVFTHNDCALAAAPK